MASTQFTLDDLRRILREAAGADENVDLDADIQDTTFAVLGYESIALLETGGRIEREYSIVLDDDDLGDDLTPRDLLDIVNAQLSPSGARAA
ncbi:phosphopantetheine-binding protein [Streptomyces sp. SID5789]|uniref:phosphopantetheine-binding protein n=1 Tax=Streptomyces sp. SID5789 TaxID=2690310 RepID=UPI001368CFC8|nr:phosphopantetheine-binding protein [Streptomyces sp. SID5789]MZE67832.1 acyl carrier protein [Streptomyces sp. SID5789]